MRLLFFNRTDELFEFPCNGEETASSARLAIRRKDPNSCSGPKYTQLVRDFRH
jgi:hypothetical protein